MRLLLTLDSDKPHRSEVAITLKSWGHVFADRASYRSKKPHVYQKPGWSYKRSGTFYHRDFAGRIKEKPFGDRYLHHSDGSLRNLIVACTDQIYEAPGTSTWRRTYVRNVAPMKVRAATWVVDFMHDPESWPDYAIILLRTIPAALCMQLFVSGLRLHADAIRN
jgi:hypothetical protein